MVDETTFVRWGQVGRYYIDIRIPVESADADHLDRMGFAGHIDVGGCICEWHRAIDFQPPNGSRDVARLALDGDKLQESGNVEIGSSANYEETFIRIKAGARRLVALQRRDGRAQLLMINDIFLYAHQRRKPLPQQSSVRDFIAASSGTDGLEEIYACDISMGTIEMGRNQLVISHSVNPAREGCLLFDSGMVEQADWRVVHGAIDDETRKTICHA